MRTPFRALYIACVSMCFIRQSFLILYSYIYIYIYLNMIIRRGTLEYNTAPWILHPGLQWHNVTSTRIFLLHRSRECHSTYHHRERLRENSQIRLDISGQGKRTWSPNARDMWSTSVWYVDTNRNSSKFIKAWKFPVLINSFKNRHIQQWVTFAFS